jgi:hypothetical protein
MTPSFLSSALGDIVVEKVLADSAGRELLRTERNVFANIQGREDGSGRGMTDRSPVIYEVGNPEEAARSAENLDFGNRVFSGVFLISTDIYIRQELRTKAAMEYKY